MPRLVLADRRFDSSLGSTLNRRRSLRSGRWLASITLSLALSLPHVAAAQEVSSQAKLYFSNGVELLQSSPPNYQDAYYQFKLAYQESKSWKVLGNLGLCALKLERDGEAFQAYTEYLQQGGNEIDPGERAALEREMLLISGNSAPVQITASEPGTEVVDSRSGSSAPAQNYKLEGDTLELRLRAGSHTLRATAPDGRTRTWEVSISPGKEASHHFDFDAQETPPGGGGGGGGGGGARVQVRETGGALRVVGFVVTGVGAAALMGGAITGILAKNKEDEATKDCYASTDSTGKPIQRCPPGGEAALDSADDLAKTTNYLLIGGGVLAAAGITMIIFGGPVETTTSAKVEPPRRRLAVQPVFGPAGGGLYATGTF